MKPDILWLQDTGVLKKIEGDYLKVPNPRPLPKLKINQSLSISQLAASFILEVSGIIISILIFTVELLQRKNYKANGTRNQESWIAPTREITPNGNKPWTMYVNIIE